MVLPNLPDYPFEPPPGLRVVSHAAGDVLASPLLPHLLQAVDELAHVASPALERAPGFYDEAAEALRQKTSTLPRSDLPQALTDFIVVYVKLTRKLALELRTSLADEAGRLDSAHVEYALRVERLMAPVLQPRTPAAPPAAPPAAVLVAPPAAPAAAVANKRTRATRLDKAQTETLMAWFLAHLDSPYPTNEEKADMAGQTGLALEQVKNWFTNTRKRSYIPVVQHGRAPQTVVDFRILEAWQARSL